MGSREGERGREREREREMGERGAKTGMSMRCARLCVRGGGREDD